MKFTYKHTNDGTGKQFFEVKVETGNGAQIFVFDTLREVHAFRCGFHTASFAIKDLITSIPVMMQEPS